MLGKGLEELDVKSLIDARVSRGHNSRKGNELTRNVHQGITKIKEALGPAGNQTVFRNVGLLTSTILGVAESTVFSHVNATPEPKRKTVPETRKRRRERAAASLSVEEKSSIFEHLQTCWKNDVHVNLKTLLEWAKDHLRYKYGRSTFALALAGMGLCYKQKSHNPTVEERKDIVVLRRSFLEKMYRMRQQHSYICYFDETWVFQGMVLNKGWQVRWGTPYERARMVCSEMPVPGPKKGKNKGKRAIVVGVIAEDGVLPGTAKVWVSGGKVADQREDYHGDMNAEQYENYMVTDVLPQLLATARRLQRPPVLVIDNASYHCRTIDKAPTSSSRVDEIKRFLDAHRVPYGTRDKKADLYSKTVDVIKALGGRTVFRKYALDEHARSLGVTIVRLPPYHCFLNPIEFLWSQLKQHVRTVGSTSSSLEEVRRESLEFMHRFTAEDARKLFEHVKNAEDDVRHLLAARDEEYDEIINEKEQMQMANGIDEFGDDFLDELEDEEDEDVEDDDFVTEPSLSLYQASAACFKAAAAYRMRDSATLMRDAANCIHDASRMLMNFSQDN